ncbi:MAG: YggT family protein [Lancefieldella sp.]
MRLIEVYEFLIAAWCLLSWIPSSSRQLMSVREALGTLVEPYLSLFRRFIPTFSGMDFSPIVALIVLQLVERLIWNILV